MPAVKGEGMRGLSVFISDIRGCEYEMVGLGLTPASMADSAESSILGTFS